MSELIEPIKIDGLKQFGRDLKKLDNDLPKAVRLALNQAADVIVAEAKPRVPYKTGKAQGSIKAKSTRTKVRVSGGGKRAPHYPWLDFGGRVGKSKSVVRPFKKEGRYIYAAYFEKKQSGEFADVLSTALIQVANSAGIEVTD
ncbi:MAG: HK97 gp10 family phage protein [Acidimicrobiales bacterium]